MVLTTAEQMALAVLRGDTLAARALADLLLENTAHGAVQLPPVRVLTTVDVDRLRVVVYIKDHAEADEEDVRLLRVALNEWITGRDRNALVLASIDRIEVYELPPLPKASTKEQTRFASNEILPWGQ